MNAIRPHTESKADPTPGLPSIRLPAVLLLAAALLAGLSACDPYAQDSYREYLVVESYLVAGAPLPEVRLTRTLPLEEEYTLQKAGVPDASIRIMQLNESESAVNTYTYRYDEEGTYLPVDNSARIRAGRRYRLVAEVAGEEPVRAETLVPGAFQATDVAVDSAAYQSDNQIEVTTTPSYYPGRQSFFLFTLEVQDPTVVELTPFYLDQYVQTDDGEERRQLLEELAKNSSGIINERNYERNDNQTITLRLPWIAVAYYGPNDLIASAIDDNMYDFLRSQSVQTGGSTLPPGEVQNVRYHVEGGIGIFGSLATDTVSIYIVRNHDLP
ncbi:MAG: DUF4249 domain-containing protein [Balneolaceae bacterium]|nr:DUF4249 domain-containing protein [Balneolaceae bacterium]